MNSRECRFCAYCDLERINEQGEIRCKRYSFYTNKFYTCDDFISIGTKKLIEELRKNKGETK